MIFIWIIIVLVLVYLLAGMGIYFIGTQHVQPGRKSIVRQANKKRLFINESLKVSLLTSTRELPLKEKEKVPWNVVLVIDKSISMRRKSALTHAKEAAKNLIASTPHHFYYSVVEFESSARICSQFTNHLPKLKLAIDKIVSSGGTAIHEGLALAHDLIKQETGTDGKNAVILLSDGGSDETLALEQAEALEKAGVTIYTVGLGQCNRGLLEKIAGDKERFFYAAKPTELKNFFFAVGRKIQNAAANNIELTEYPAISRNPLQLSKYGDIRPMVTVLYQTEAPLVKWFLPGLEKEYTRIDYELKPQCYGWYRIAYDKAELNLKDENNEGFTFRSNKGPYVLVIPRFFLCRVLWIFLNPLLWMLIQERSCKYREYRFDRKYTPPEKLTDTPIETLPALAPAFSLGVTPTLVIGMGFGGISAVTHLKHLFHQHNEDDKIKSRVAFLGIDSVKPYFSEQIIIGTTALTAAEKIFLHTPTTRYMGNQARQNEAGKEHIWLDAKKISAEGVDYDVGSGTHLNRQIGRLMILLNPGHIDRIKRILKDLHEKNAGEPLNVCLTGTMSGGTATGMLLDLSYSLKKIIKELNIPGVGINLFLMEAGVDPDENRTGLKKTAMENNRQAFVHELARFFATRDTAAAPLPGVEALDKWFDQVIRIDKKETGKNQFALYPQGAVLLYQWIVEKSFRDIVIANSKHITHGLLVQDFEVNVVFLFKRMLEDYFAARLLLTVIGNLILGLGENPPDYLLKSVTVAEQTTADALELLLTGSEWENSRPLLLLHDSLIKAPDEQKFSHFLSNGGLDGIVENSPPEQIEDFLDNEETVFKGLIYAWSESIMKNREPETEATNTFARKKLPIVSGTLAKLTSNLELIKKFAGSISDCESPLDRHQCRVLLEMCERFIQVLAPWRANLELWAQVLGEGTACFIGVCRKLNDTLNRLERAIESTQFYKTPHFVFNKRLKETLYQRYFQDLEPDILRQFQWVPGIEEDFILRIITDKAPAKEFKVDLNRPALIDEILDTAAAIPGYLASRKNKWNKVTIEDFLSLCREAGYNVAAEYFYPRAREVEDHGILSLNSSIYNAIQDQVSPGVMHQKLDSGNPFIAGFFKYRINHEILKTGPGINFESMPYFVFAEEWNCYNALSIYRYMTKKEVQPPLYPVVILCKDMKKFLGAVKAGIMDNRIESVQDGVQIVYRFETLKGPQSGDKDRDIFNFLRIIVEASDSSVLQVLEQGFVEALKMNSALIEESILQTRVPLSTFVKTQLFQVVFGGLEYFRHLS